jgi:Na+-transporting NADH:ubiquinone oxidoreductase subunit NqrA
MGDVSSSLDVISSLDSDVAFIRRNVRDLAKTAQFSHMAELDELHQMAFTNLKNQLLPGKPLSEDPQLVLEAYKTLSTVVMQVVDTKRKAADTLIKARVLIDVPHAESSIIDVEDMSEDVPAGSEGETGIFGSIAGGDPVTSL